MRRERCFTRPRRAVNWRSRGAPLPRRRAGAVPFLWWGGPFRIDRKREALGLTILHAGLLLLLQVITSLRMAP